MKTPRVQVARDYESDEPIEYACDSLEDFLASAKAGLLPKGTYIHVMWPEDRDRLEVTITAWSHIDPETGETFPGWLCDHSGPCECPVPMEIPILDFTDIRFADLFKALLAASIPSEMMPSDEDLEPGW